MGKMELEGQYSKTLSVTHTLKLRTKLKSTVLYIKWLRNAYILQQL